MFEGTARIGFEVFLFALLVFGMVLIITYMILHARSKQAGMTQAEWEQREEKLMLLYFEVEDMINGLKEYVENARSVIGLEYDRARAEANGLELGKALQETRQQQMTAPAPPQAAPIQAEKPSEPAEELPRRDELQRRVLALAAENRTPAEIAEEVQISKSEVRLILRLGRQ